MPIYTYEARDGSTVERYHEMSEAPKIGARIRVKGKTYRRVMDYGRRGQGHLAVEPDFKHSTFALTPEQAKQVCRRFDANGDGILETRRDIENAQSKLNAMGIPMHYDFGIHGKKKGTRIA